MTEQPASPPGMSIDGESPKKAYQTPRLVVYGDIRRLTLNLARNNVRDGGGNNLRT